MDIVTAVWIVIAVVLVVVSVFLIQTLIEIRRAAISAKGLLARIDTDLVPVTRDLHEVLADLRVTTRGIASRVEDVKSAMTAVGDTGRNISMINAAIGNVADLLSRVSLLSTGAKAAGQYVCDRISRKRG